MAADAVRPDPGKLAPAASADPAALRERLAARGEALAVVRGRSMEPLLRDGDVVRLLPGGVAVARPGDLVAVTWGGAVVVHRLVALDGARLVCRGDNRGAPDPPLTPDALLGRAVAVWRRGRWRPLPGGRAGRALAAAAHGRLRLRHGLGHAAAEARLLLAQARGAGEPSPPAAPPSWPRGLPAGGQRAAAAVDAWAAGALDSGARLAAVAAALRAAAGGEVAVCAFAFHPRYRLARLGALVRRLAALAGRRAGEPGDAVLASADGWRPVHLFTADELAALALAAGGRVAGLRPATDPAGPPLWVVSAVRRGGDCRPPGEAGGLGNP